MKLFDRKFGADFVAALPNAPGVYLFRDARGDVLYVGKAISLRKRLFTYRNATRSKAHRKMRVLLRQAESLEVRPLESEREALLTENDLIRSLRPPFNVDGAFSFLYPVIGRCHLPDHDLFCFTTYPDTYTGLDFRWHGAFRSRLRAREAFDAMIELLTLLAHIEPVSRLPPHPVQRGSRVVGFRRLHSDVCAEVDKLLSGSDSAPLGVLAEFLLEKPRARREAERVEECLRCLASFYQTDLRRLRRALDSAGIAGTFIEQDHRDALFIRTSESVRTQAQTSRRINPAPGARRG